MADFNIALEKMIDAGGGYKLHQVAGDKGGMTYAEISRNYHPGWPGWKVIDTGETSKEILAPLVKAFYEDFWAEIKGDQIMFQGVAEIIFNFFVTSGDDAIKIAQKIVGTKIDGDLGPKTIQKISAYITDETTERLFIAEYKLERIYHYKNACVNDKRRCWDRVGSNLKFLCGWINRVQAGA